MTVAEPQVAVGSILFTDLVGFTEYNDAVGDLAATVVLDQQRALVDALLDDGAARVVKEIGDGLMLWFASAASGLRLAIAILGALDRARAVDDFPLSVRMGLHHGESVERGDDLVGHTVNVAARVSALAGPGELLVSEDVLVACGDDRSGATLRPVGPVVVKGVRSPIWLHRYVAR